MKVIKLLFIAMLLCDCSGPKWAIENNSIAIIQRDVINDSVTVTVTAVKETSSAPNSIAEKETKPIEQDNVSNDAKEAYSKKEACPVHNTWDELLKKHVSDTGNVNYKGIKTDWKSLQDYIVYLGNKLPKDTWAKEGKLAYWINAYNAMTIDLILRHYPLKSIKDINDPWKQRHWKLGDKWYNLDEIEHQILRKMDEPRIHFAIVCASYSCPNLLNEAYIASNLNEQLTLATKAFLNDPERNSISKNHLELSKIFKWFPEDFKKNGGLIDFLNQYSEIEISEQAKIKYKNYNWALNE